MLTFGLTPPYTNQHPALQTQRVWRVGRGSFVRILNVTLDCDEVYDIYETLDLEGNDSNYDETKAATKTNIFRQIHTRNSRNSNFETDAAAR
ncbi:hypothetical protein DPMN_147506 [Dreissena polymorpha]|uniref:Uncharacterized protein n=1 Tax=Dreissena polymorpha TaxID=45954 RepID=A0A9D4FAN7_DREPO|nr:hypothetical protein DPMN_147506 [Dreissena polymorpha]